ncbi:MAG: matrixin family metalloprotease [Vicinamibacterales bacterium]
MARRPSWLSLGLGLLFSLVLLTGAHAQSSSPGLVLRGRVSAARAQWDDTRTLFTYVTIDVDEVSVGVGVPRRIVLKQLGGRIGDVGLWIADQAVFASGDEMLLDLAVSPRDGTLHTRALGHGAWRIATSTTTGARDAIGDTRTSLTSRVEALAATRTAPTRFVAVPTEYAAADLRTPLFSYLPTGTAYPPRWHQVDDGTPVFVDHPSSLPATWSGATSDVGDAIGLWRGTGMDLDLLDGGASLGAGQCPFTFTGNGRIAVAYNDPCRTVADWSVGGGYYTTADLRVVNGQTFQKFVQGAVVLNDAGPQTNSAGCFQDALTHGLGHALGLGHSSASGAIMQAGPPGSCPANGSGLTSDDAQGITSIYQGIPAAVAPPDAPTAITASAALSTVTIGWTPAATGGAVQKYLIDAGTVAGVYNLGSLVVNAPATSTSVANVPAGTYYLRARAQNLLGTSTASPETSVTVGACVAPGPPVSFTASSNDTAVLLQWTPPAAGVVQGYVVTAGTAPGLANLAAVPLPVSPTAFAASVPYGAYYVRVQATNVCGTSAPSNEQLLTVTPCTSAPAAPTALTSSVANGIVTLQWTAPATGPAPTGYTLRVGSVPGGSDVLVYPTRSTATALAAPAPRGTYYVRVVATNACGASVESNAIVVSVP